MSRLMLSYPGTTESKVEPRGGFGWTVIVGKSGLCFLWQGKMQSVNLNHPRHMSHQRERVREKRKKRNTHKVILDSQINA